MAAEAKYRFLPLATSLLSVVAAAVVAVLTAACQPANLPKTGAAEPVDTPQMKPSRTATVQVAAAAFRELSRLDRSLRPFLNISSPTDPTDPFSGCRKAGEIRDGHSNTDWRCEVDLVGLRKLAIRGVETSEFKQAANLLNAEGRFETRYLDDLEANGQPYTVQTRRVVKLQFESGSTREGFRGRLQIKTEAMKKNISRQSLGTNWTSTVAGFVHNKDGKVVLEKGARITLRGSLYGEYGERKNPWASGGFALIADSDITLSGLSDGPCIKPNGSWRVIAEGAGEKLETSIASTDSAIIEARGAQTGWSRLMCFEP